MNEHQTDPQTIELVEVIEKRILEQSKVEGVIILKSRIRNIDGRILEVVQFVSEGLLTDPDMDIDEYIKMAATTALREKDENKHE